MKRSISHTEIETAMACWARWDFAYGGRLAGSALKRKLDAPKLREGRAWGRAVAALHSVVESKTPALAGSPLPRLRADGHTVTELAPSFESVNGERSPAPDRPGGRLAVGDRTFLRYMRGLDAILDSLQEDADQQREHGLYDRAEHDDTYTRLADMLWHYASTSEPLEVHGLEHELQVPLPSRTGKRSSNRYAYHGFLDALTDTYPGYEGRLFIVEYKLRDRLTDAVHIVNGRQVRRYAWALEQHLGRPVDGVIVDERLNEVPKPARWVKGRKKGEGMVPSHAKDQLTSQELYERACLDAKVTPDPDTWIALGQRRWQQRQLVLFRRSEIHEASKELVSAAQLIAQLDSGVLFPVRNTSPQRCGACRYREICPDPTDDELVDLGFERVAPKRMREEVAA